MKNENLFSKYIYAKTNDKSTIFNISNLKGIYNDSWANPPRDKDGMVDIKDVFVSTAIGDVETLDRKNVPKPIEDRQIQNKEVPDNVIDMTKKLKEKNTKSPPTPDDYEDIALWSMVV